MAYKLKKRVALNFLGNLQFKIEPHFTLPNFEGISQHEMWEHTMDYPASNGQRVLSPELNLLMLTRHAASKSYYHAQLSRLLPDAAMVMGEKVDFSKLRSLADSWHLPYPGNLLAAFPEFFPAESISAFSSDPRKVGEFRKSFKLRAKLGEQDFVSLTLGRYEMQGSILRGLLGHFRSLRPSRIRSIYHLPPHGAWPNVAWSYVCWFLARSLRAIDWVRSPPLLREYVRLVEDMES